jgi:DNA mismatch repair protein MSH2
VAKFLYKSTAQVTYIDGSKDTGLPGITLSYNLFPSVLKELLVNSSEYNVEWYESESHSDAWVCTRKASPGRLGDFESDLAKAGDLEDSPIIVSITLGYIDGVRTVGLAYLDETKHKMGACEFTDDDHFCSCETALTQLGPKEIVIPVDISTDEQDTNSSIGKADKARLAHVLSHCSALVSKKPKITFSVKNLAQDLSHLLQGAKEGVELNRPVLDLKLGSSALAGILQFVDILADKSSHSRYSLEVYNMGKYMRLDAAAQKALNVLKSKTDVNESFSLYGLMNKCRTPMGKRLLKAWLKQPLTDIEEIQRRMDVVESFVIDSSMRSDINGLHLRGMPDIDRLTRKLDRQTATLQDLCQLYRVSSRLPFIENVLNSCDNHHKQALDHFVDSLAQAHSPDRLAKFEELIEAAIDLDRIPDEYLISPAYDAELGDIQVQKENVEKNITEAAEAAANDLGLILDKTIKLEWHKVSNQKIRCLRITAKEEKSVRKKLQAKYIELETRKDGVKFTSRHLRSAAEELQRLSSEYNSKQAKLVSQVVAVAATFSQVWENVSGILAELDVLCGFSELSISAPTQYVRPKLLPSDGHEIRLKGSRHPCVESQDGVSFIPNDVSLVKGESWFQLITGPNMGGKSTYIRQIGMCVLMAQVGCFVPCDEAVISVRDAIFARVGAGDCQLRGVSTFMAEMLETASILKGATSSSLVIIDELGRGTSTWDGMGLAWAISEHLMEKIGAATLFATHFHELTSLQGSVGVRNLHVKSAIDPSCGGLTMLYQVHEGSCDESLGIHVAEFARFPKSVIEDAKAKAKDLSHMTIEITAATDPQGKKRSANNDDSIKQALEQFASIRFETMSEDDIKLEAAKWINEFSALIPSEAKKTTLS